MKKNFIHTVIIEYWFPLYTFCILFLNSSLNDLPNAKQYNSFEEVTTNVWEDSDERDIGVELWRLEVKSVS